MAKVLVVGGGAAGKLTLAALTASNLVVGSGGAVTLGDVFVQQIAVSGGGLAVEKVTGNGGTIDLGGTNVSVSSGGTAYASGCTFSGGSATSGGAINGTADLIGVIVSGNTAAFGGGIATTKKVTLTSCFVSGNVAASRGNDLWGFQGAYDITGSTVGDIQLGGGAVVTLVGSNDINTIAPYTSASYGSVTLTSGAILDLTGNSNSTPINPGGGIAFASGGATVLYDSGGNGSASSAFIDNLKANTIGNSGAVALTSGNSVGSGGFVAASGAHLTSGYIACYSGGSVSLQDVTLGGGGNMVIYPDSFTGLGGEVTIGGKITILSNGYIGYNVSSGVTPTGTVTIKSGAIIDRSEASAEGRFRANQFVVEGNITYIAYGGSEFTISAGTYTRIAPDGTTEPPQA